MQSCLHRDDEGSSSFLANLQERVGIFMGRGDGTAEVSGGGKGTSSSNAVSADQLVKRLLKKGKAVDDMASDFATLSGGDGQMTRAVRRCARQAGGKSATAQSTRPTPLHPHPTLPSAEPARVVLQ